MIKSAVLITRTLPVSIATTGTTSTTSIKNGTSLARRLTSSRRYQSTSTSISTSSSSSSSTLTLYQYAICPYCNIAKALLNYTNTPFEAKEVNPLTKAELKSLPDKEYKKVPILTVGVLEDEDDHDHDHDHDEASNQVQQVNGSEAIVDHLLSSILVAVPSTENSTIDATSPSALKWTDFARNDLAPLLYPNLCNTLSNSYQAFGYVHAAGTPFSLTQRYSIQFVGSIAMYMAASKIKKKRNITDERAALLEALQEMDSQLTLPENLFLSAQETPHLGDVTAFGVLRGLQGLAVMETVYQAYPSIRQWYLRMEQAVETKTATEATEATTTTTTEN